MRKIVKNSSVCLSVFLLAISLVLVVPQTSFAATSGCKKTSTITVNIKSCWAYPGSSSITITNNKVKVSYTSGWFFKNTKTKTIYGTYNVHVESTDGKHKFNKTMSGLV